MRLTDCFTGLFAYTIFLVNPENVHMTPFEKAYGDIDRLISESEQLGQEGSFAKNDLDLARFAVFSWMDEMILSSSWEGKDRWLGEQLQRRYFQTADAGEIFFDKLNEVGPHQMDVREVYYLCLSMGFTGRYCNPGDDILLDQLKTSNLKVLTGSAVGMPDINRETLFPDAYGSHLIEDKKSTYGKEKISLFTLACFGGPIALYGLLFVLYRFILSNIGNNLMGALP